MKPISLDIISCVSNSESDPGEIYRNRMKSLELLRTEPSAICMEWKQLPCGFEKIYHKFQILEIYQS